MYYLRSSKKPTNATVFCSAETTATPISSEKATPSLNAVTPKATSTPGLSLASLLVSHIEGLKSLNPILKLLYSLICSSLSYEVCQGNRGDRAAWDHFKLELEDTVTLSSILFKELHKRLGCLSDEASLDRDVGSVIIHVDGMDSVEELLLLLRCCILMVRLRPHDQILTKQFQVVVALLHKLSNQRVSIRLNKPISSKKIYGSHANSSSLDFSAQSSDTYLRLLQQMLEVYLDEVFADRPFRELLAISVSVSSTHHNLSVFSSIQIEFVLDVLAAHFLMSISGQDQVLQTLAKSLIWTEKPILSSPEVSLAVASSLINHPVMTSSPILLLSHLISLVSEVIGICISPVKMGRNNRCVNIYISMFYDSFSLYCEHMSKLMTGSCISGRTVLRPFESHFRSRIFDRIKLVHAELDNEWRALRSSNYKKTTDNLTVDAISYLKMNIYVVDEAYRDEVFSFLSSLVARLVSVKSDEVLLQSFKEMTMQDFCLLASTLKLMSCSLLQATRGLDNNLSCLTALLKRKDALPGYSSLYNFHIPIQVQQLIIDGLTPHLPIYEGFESMFVHYAGLLLSCIFSGLPTLMRGCLYFMLVLMNTLALESRIESPACVFSRVIVNSSLCSSNAQSFGRCQKTSSVRVASNFRRERRKLLREHTTSEVSEISDAETCNGELFLKCVLNNRNDISELADFIECTPWRDYNARLLCKAKARRRRSQETARRLLQAKIKVYNSFRNGCKKKLKGKPAEVQSIF